MRVTKILLSYLQGHKESPLPNTIWLSRTLILLVTKWWNFPLRCSVQLHRLKGAQSIWGSKLSSSHHSLIHSLTFYIHTSISFYSSNIELFPWSICKLIWAIKGWEAEFKSGKRVSTLMIQPGSRICCPFIKEGIYQRTYLLCIHKYVTELAGYCRQTSATRTSWSTTSNNRFHIMHKLQKSLGF